MKTHRIVFVMIVFLISNIGFAQGTKRNRVQTEIEIGSFFSRTTIGVNAKVGYLIKNTLFLGGGTGLEYLYKARDVPVKISCVPLTFMLLQPRQ